MTDDEGDASISQVETADFADHSTASGESKRNGSSGRKGNGSEVRHSIPCIVLYCIVSSCLVLYCIVLYCIVLYCIVLYCVVLCCIVLSSLVLSCLAPYSDCAHTLLLYWLFYLSN